MFVPIHDVKYYKEITIRMDWQQVKERTMDDYKQKLCNDGYSFSHITYPTDKDEYYYYHYKKSVELVVTNV